MTQTYGYFCPSCKTRWQASSCDKEKKLCPKGHSLLEAYWIYRKDFTFGIRISIEDHNDFSIRDYIKFKNSREKNSGLKEWVEAACERDPERADVYQNVYNTSSDSYV